MSAKKQIEYDVYVAMTTYSPKEIEYIYSGPMEDESSLAIFPSKIDAECRTLGSDDIRKAKLIIYETS